MLLAAIFVSACGDDSTSVDGSASATDGSTGSTESTSSPSTTLTTTSATVDDTGETQGPTTEPDTGSTSTGSDSDSTATGTDETGTTGEPPEVLPGQTASQLVTAGTRSSSASFTVVYTLGQPSTLQSTHDSANYRLQGGLIGANGSPP